MKRVPLSPLVIFCNADRYSAFPATPWMDAAVALTASRTTDGLTFPVALADRTATTGSKQLARFVYLAKNTTASDTTVRFAWVAGVVHVQKK